MSDLIPLNIDRHIDSGDRNRPIARPDDLVNLRQCIEEDLGISPATRGAQHLIDLLTVATAMSYWKVCSCSDQSGRFLDVVDQLWEAAGKLMGKDRMRSRTDVRAALGRAQCAEASFWALVGFEKLFQAAARVFFGMPGSRHHILATALLMPPPMGTRWQIAESPIGRVVDDIKRNYQKDVNGGSIDRTDAMFSGIDHCGNDRACTVALEEVADVPSDAVMVRQYTDHSLAELQQTVAEDNDLRVYIKARLRPGGTLEEICRYLGWTLARGQRVSRRFRRLRDKLLEETDFREDQVESRRRAPSLVTFCLERLYSGLAVYQHVPPGPPEFYGRKPRK